MSTALRVCIDKYLPRAVLFEAAERAIAENPANTGDFGSIHRLCSFAPQQFHPVQLALVTGNKWAVGRTLKVGFLDGDASSKAKVEQWARGWLKYANIKFDFAGSAPELRISFRQDGAWSYMGTDNLSIPRSQPTMNFGWLDEGVVLHEFGHALGCIHEHQNPGGTIQWNKEAAYAFYGRNGWTRQMVDQNVFQKYAVNITQYTALDPQSIMMYPIPVGLTLDGFTTPGGIVLSETDKAAIAKVYPGTVEPPPPPPPGTLTPTELAVKFSDGSIWQGSVARRAEELPTAEEVTEDDAGEPLTA